MTPDGVASRIRILVKESGHDPADPLACFITACIVLAEVAPHLSIPYLRGLVNGKPATPPARSSRHDIYP